MHKTYQRMQEAYDLRCTNKSDLAASSLYREILPSVYLSLYMTLRQILDKRMGK